MSVGPFPLAEVIERLRSEVPSIRFLGTAADLRTALEQQPAQVPAVFVVITEHASPSKGFSGQLDQTVDVSLSLVQMTRNYAQATAGAPARSDMDALSQDNRTALIGWSPSSAYRRLQLRAARDESFKGALLVHQEVFFTSYQIRVSA